MKAEWTKIWNCYFEKKLKVGNNVLGMIKKHVTLKKYGIEATVELICIGRKMFRLDQEDQAKAWVESELRRQVRELVDIVGRRK